MNVTLADSDLQFVNDQLSLGEFESADEIVAQGLQRLRVEKIIEEIGSEEVERKIAEGLEDIREGRVAEADIVFSRIQEKLRARWG
ncbi:MAG: antitoxin ParD1/3/4 [Verrucomicrobiales bacterium]|jgi:antitoxin ParD1/3/4